MTNAVLGLASGYPPTVYERFLKSLRQSGFAGAVALFSEFPLREGVKETCDKHDAEIHAFSVAPYHVQSFRYHLFEKYLHDHEYAFVFLSDVRDLLFQRDLFSSRVLADADLVFFVEDMTVSRCPYNSGWIKHAFGKQMMEQLRDERVICSGTTFGRYDAVRRYLKVMNEVTRGLVANRVAIIQGLDQGIHNVLYYRGRWEGKNVTLLDNSHGLVYTMGHAKKLMEEGRGVVDELGRVVYAAHQFDRMSAEQVRLLGQDRGIPVGDLVD